MRELSLSTYGSEGDGARENKKGKKWELSRKKKNAQDAGVEGRIVKNLASKTPSGLKSV